MKAWRLQRLGGELRFSDVRTPEPRPGSALVRIEASALMSYLKAYVEGKLPVYNPPPGPFTIGTNGVGVVEAVGRDVWHLKPGQRVVLSSHFVAAENVEDPAQILIGLTSSPDAAQVLADWPDGTLAEYALMPVAALTPAEGLEEFDSTGLVTIGRFIIPFGGLLRGRLAAGETLVVNGATGAYGTAAVLLGVAMGAAQVIAAGRNQDALEAVARAGGPRVSTVTLTGEVQNDASALREATGGGAHMAFDMVGQARDPKATLAGLHSLRRGGRLVLMGSADAPLELSFREMLANDWEVVGKFMYARTAPGQLAALAAEGLLDLRKIIVTTFALADFKRAVEAAALMQGLDLTALVP